MCSFIDLISFRHSFRNPSRLWLCFIFMDPQADLGPNGIPRGSISPCKVKIKISNPRNTPISQRSISIRDLITTHNSNKVRRGWPLVLQLVNHRCTTATGRRTNCPATIRSRRYPSSVRRLVSSSRASLCPSSLRGLGACRTRLLAHRCGETKA